jgi:hypothetical protein
MQGKFNGFLVGKAEVSPEFCKAGYCILMPEA